MKRKHVVGKIKNFDNRQEAELVLWEEVRKDCGYPETDDNDGYTYGLNFMEGDDISDVEWYKTIEERNQVIKDLDLKIINCCG
jgi:hypothetical protein